MSGLGLNGGIIGIGKETTYGDAVARTNVICANSDGLAVEEEELVSGCLNGRFLNIDNIYKGNISAGGDVEFDLRYEGSELLFENLLGKRVTTEEDAYTIDATNDKIDFKEDTGSGLGSELTATLTQANYPIGDTSAVAGSLCAEIKAKLEVAGAGTYTVAYDRTTKKITISVTGLTSAQFLWLTGTNTLVNTATLLGYSKLADSAAATSFVADNTIESAYKHTFTSPASTADLQKGLTMEFLIDKLLTTGKSKLYNGCMLGSMDINAEAGQLITASMNIMAKQETLLDTETVSALPYTLKQIAQARQIVVKYAGTEEALVNTFSATLGMMLKEDRYHIGSNERNKPIPNGKMEITGTMELEFTGKEKYDDFRNNTTRAILLEITGDDNIVGTTKYSIRLSLPTTKIGGSTPQVSDSGVIVVEIPFKAGGVDVNNQGVVVEIVNSLYLA